MRTILCDRSQTELVASLVSIWHGRAQRCVCDRGRIQVLKYNSEMRDSDGFLGNELDSRAAR
jgi:hypothetical protein